MGLSSVHLVFKVAFGTGRFLVCGPHGILESRPHERNDRLHLASDLGPR